LFRISKAPLSEDPNAWGSDTIKCSICSYQFNVVFLIKKALASLTDLSVMQADKKIWLEMVTYLSMICSKDRESLDQEEPINEEGHLVQEHTLAEVETEPVDAARG